MDPTLRTVSQIPIARLWNATGHFEATRARCLTRELLHEMLQSHPVKFIIADVGHPLRHVEVARCYEFWKSEVVRHLVNDPAAGFRLGEFPGAFAYCASEWSGELQTPIVLLEKYH